MEKLTQTTASGFKASISSHGSETKWSVDYSEHEGGPWEEVTGGSGTIPAGGSKEIIAGELTGLTPATIYYMRFVATNGFGTTYNYDGGPKDEPPATFETVPLRPRAACCRVSKLVGTSAGVVGEVIPDDSETSWRIEYATSQEVLEKDAGTAASEGVIPAAEANEAFHNVEGELTGLKPETVYYVSVFAENTNGVVTGRREYQRIETGGRPSVTTFAAHSVQGGALRALGSVVPHGFDTHLYAEYMTQEHFAATGWAGAESTSAVDVGAGEYQSSIPGYPAEIMGVDVLGLHAGVSYRYRLVASNGAPGGAAVDGGEQSLTVPAVVSGGAEACPNASLRMGLSAGLADCRAYELVTPADKEGAMDIDTYGAVTDVASIGEDGDHLMFKAPFTQWGSSFDSKDTTYAFTRTSSGWQMGTLTPQPQAGENSYLPAIFSPDLSQVGIEVGWSSSQASESPDVEFEAGPSGGPYVTAATIPRKDSGRWVGGSANGEKLILASDDHTLLGRSTGTSSDSDLYEFTGGELRQVNVLSNGGKIGVCGAHMVKGYEGYQETEIQTELESTSPNAVSADGSRVFFYAGGAGECPTENELQAGAGSDVHLYMRVDSGGGNAETVEIGDYKFLAANAQGSELLLEGFNGTKHEFVLYNVDSKGSKSLFTTTDEVKYPIVAVDSVGLSAFYFRSPEQLTSEAPPISTNSEDLGGAGEVENTYRYDFGSDSLAFIAQAGVAGGLGGGYSVSPDGDNYYFASTGVAGVPSGGEEAPKEVPGRDSVQVYRYNGEEGVVQCMSCASLFDPGPKLGADFLFGRVVTGDGVPNMSIASDNGDYVFFESTAALVPEDIDGEIPGDDNLSGRNEFVEFVRSPSSDVYEWRRDGVGGCGLVGGCVSLVSGGTGGYKTELLGTTPSGDDVFFATHEELVAGDTDQAGDVYDARVDGGFPPQAPRPVECEGDSCSTPFAAPSDLTPATATFQGVGDVSSEAGSPAATGKAKPKAKKKPKRKTKAKAKAKRKRMRRSGVSDHGKGR